jgi:hypothetical protein
VSLLGLQAVIAVVGLIAVIFLVLFRKVFLSTRKLKSTNLDWINDFSVVRYRPMERLLAEEDYRFLESQPAINRAIMRRFRAERRAIFREYLRSLSEDFDRLCGAVQALTLASGEDRPDLAVALLKSRLNFACASLAVEMRLICHWMGFGGVEIRGLVGSLEATWSELQHLVPAVQLQGSAA